MTKNEWEDQKILIYSGRPSEKNGGSYLNPRER